MSETVDAIRQKDEEARKLLQAATRVIEAKTALAEAQVALKDFLGDEPAPPDEPEPEPEPENHWANYLEYNKTLRTWFVSFGIGGPVLFLVNPAILEALKKSEVGPWVVGLFLAGCGLQIFVALLNKIISWNLYGGESDEPYRETFRYKACEFFNSFWIDAFFDVLSLAAFVSAVVLMFQLNLGDNGPVISPPMPK